MSDHHSLSEADELWADVWTAEDCEEARSLPGPIWVVGASGFIGAKLFFSLARLRPDVYAVSRSIDSSWRILRAPFLNRINLDISDARAVTTAVAHYRPRTVFNLAAYGAYERQSEVAKIHTINFIGTLNLAGTLLEAGCDAYVQAGSSSEYGLNCAGPKESGELLPNSDYAVSKVACSHLLTYLGRIKGFPCAHLRLYSVYGPWEERDRLVPRLIETGMQGRLPPFVDARVSRDFIYVDDCTRAFVRAALRSCRSKPGEAINISTGIKTSMGEIAELSRGMFGIGAEPVFGSMPNRKWDLSNWYGDPSKAAILLDWRHRIALADGLRNTAEWEKLAAARIRFGFVPTKPGKISAIIACYRDEQAIPLMHQRLTATFMTLGVDYEIIFVNDRSPVGDEHVIAGLCGGDSHVLGITHSRNFGSQSAFLSGMEIATGDAVVLLDGDLQDPPEVIAEFYKKWKEGSDIVYGVRVKREAAWYMQVLYKCFYRLFRSMSEIEIPVDAGDFSLIDRKAVEHILRMPERDVFVRGLRAWVGFAQTGVPYVRPERAFGRSTNNFLKNIWWAKKAIFSFSLKPLYYIQGIGFGLFAVSLLLSAFYLVHYLTRPPVGAPGVTTIIVLVLGLGGMQMFSLSILGDYIGKVLEEAKSRPRFIRHRIFKGDKVLSAEADLSRFVADCRSSNKIP